MYGRFTDPKLLCCLSNGSVTFYNVFRYLNCPLFNLLLCFCSDCIIPFHCIYPITVHSCYRLCRVQADYDQKQRTSQDALSCDALYHFTNSFFIFPLQCKYANVRSPSQSAPSMMQSHLPILRSCYLLHIHRGYLP